MRRTIWKFILEPGKPVMMPSACVLSVHAQHDQICIWAMVNPDTPLSPRHFNVFGTGHPLPEVPGNFLGTVLLHGGDLVMHVYEAMP